MFDFITEKLTGVLESGGAADVLSGGQLSDLLANASFDPSLIDGASFDRLGEILAQSGIDLQSLPDNQIAEAVQQLMANK